MTETELNKNIVNAAQDAAKLISTATETAAKVIANAASEALKVVNAKGEGDHDVLIEIKTQVARLIQDVANINNNLANKIEKLECDKADKKEIELLHGTTLKRLETSDSKIEALEEWRWKIAGGLVIVTAVVSYLVQKYL